MKLFYNHLPTLDLHGETSDIAKVLTDEFIKDSYKEKLEYIVIIHGVGKGIIRKTVHEYLDKSKYVDSYKQHNINHGVTIVKIKC